MGHDPTRGSCQEDIKISRVEWSRVRRRLKYHESGRVGSGGFQISRVGTGYPDSAWPVKSPADYRMFPGDGRTGSALL